MPEKSVRLDAVLVVENDLVVATDFAEAIKLAIPELRVTWSDSDGFLARGFRVPERMRAAVLSLDSGPRMRRRAGALARRGVSILVLADDGDSQAEAAGWRVLLRPVVSDDLVPFIRAALDGTDGR